MGIFKRKVEVAQVSEPLIIAGEQPTPKVEEAPINEEAVQEQIEEPVVEEVEETIEPQEEIKEEPQEEIKEEQEEPTENDFVDKLNAVIHNLDLRINNLEAAVFRAMSGKQ